MAGRSVLAENWKLPSISTGASADIGLQIMVDGFQDQKSQRIGDRSNWFPTAWSWKLVQHHCCCTHRTCIEGEERTLQGLVGGAPDTLGSCFKISAAVLVQSAVRALFCCIPRKAYCAHLKWFNQIVSKVLLHSEFPLSYSFCFPCIIDIFHSVVSLLYSLTVFWGMKLMFSPYYCTLEVWIFI